MAESADSNASGQLTDGARQEFRAAGFCASTLPIGSQSPSGRPDALCVASPAAMLTSMILPGRKIGEAHPGNSSANHSGPGFPSRPLFHDSRNWLSLVLCSCSSVLCPCLFPWPAIPSISEIELGADLEQARRQNALRLQPGLAGPGVIHVEDGHPVRVQRVGQVEVQRSSS